MALADYYQRGALAAAQALQGGFDDTQFRTLLEETPFGVSFSGAADTPEGQALLDLTVRIAARLFPVMQFDPVSAGTQADQLAELAREINPNVELVEGDAELGITIGTGGRTYTHTIHAGSHEWDAIVSTSEPQPIGSSGLPFGAGAAACLAVAEAFRRLFVASEDQGAQSFRYSTYQPGIANHEAPLTGLTDTGDTALIGAGAIGQATIWTLGRAPIQGVLHVVDPERLELSNLQRYVLSTRADESADKASLATQHLTGGIEGVAHQATLVEFLSEHGYRWDRMLLGLDSAIDRRSAQASLPHWIANAWTQPDDLGISVHPSLLTDGSCVACLYLQDHKLRDEDELIAQALGINDQVGPVRQMLVTGEGLQIPLAQLIAQRLGQPADRLEAFLGHPIRDLYVNGVCGGAVLPLGSPLAPRGDVHVPLPHQSALAGVMLAATYARSLGSEPVTQTQITRHNILRPPLGTAPQPSRKRGDGRCICEDRDFLRVYDAKWGSQDQAHHSGDVSQQAAA